MICAILAHVPSILASCNVVKFQFSGGQTHISEATLPTVLTIRFFPGAGPSHKIATSVVPRLLLDSMILAATASPETWSTARRYLEVTSLVFNGFDGLEASVYPRCSDGTDA